MVPVTSPDGSPGDDNGRRHRRALGSTAAYLVRMAPPPTHTDRLQRVLSLFLTLRQSWQPLTRAELEDRFPIYRGENGRRRFEEDKNHLDKAGIPIVKTQASG